MFFFNVKHAIVSILCVVAFFFFGIRIASASRIVDETVQIKTVNFSIEDEKPVGLNIEMLGENGNGEFPTDLKDAARLFNAKVTTSSNTPDLASFLCITNTNATFISTGPGVLTYVIKGGSSGSYELNLLTMVIGHVTPFDQVGDMEHCLGQISGDSRPEPVVNFLTMLNRDGEIEPGEYTINLTAGLYVM